MGRRAAPRLVKSVPARRQKDTKGVDGNSISIEKGAYILSRSRGNAASRREAAAGEASVSARGGELAPQGVQPKARWPVP